MNSRGGSAAGYGEAQNRVRNVNQGQARSGQARTIKCYYCNGTGHIAWNCTQPKRPQNSEYFKDKMLLMQAQENRVVLDAEQLLFLAGGLDNTFDDDVDEQPIQDLALNVDNVFQAEDCDAFDPDIDEAPTAQTMFMANLSSADPVNDEAGPSYDSDILSEVQDHDQYLDDTFPYQEEHVIHDSVQLDHVVDLHADYTSVSNMISYDQYVKDNEVSVVHSNASSVPNDTFMMMCEPSTLSVSNSSRNAVVKNSLTAELATYREQVKLPLYNDLNKVAIGYKNPLYLTRAKQAQPALYNGHEILKDNHAPAKVHNTEDTLEIAEITRKKMNAKMTDPEGVTHKLKSEALKERAKVSRPIKAFTVYPPNTPATLVPKVLPTKSQMKIHIFTLIQMFLEFDKTCEKRITPTAITDGERGFEQTKACYLQEVIPFFKTIKDNFEGIQKALTKDVKEMKDVLEELEAEVTQCAVDRKHDAIDLKNLLIANDNLIAECLSKEIFSVVTKSELNVARFAEMHVANTSVEARCLALAAELATLRDKSHQENQRKLIKHFSKLETTDSQITKSIDHVTQLQAQNDLFRAENNKIKQHYKELYDSIKITRAKHIEQVTKLTAENVILKTSVSKAKFQPPVPTRTKHVVDVESIVPRLRNNRDAHLIYLRHLKEIVETIRDIVEEAKVLAHTPLIRKKQVTATKPSDRQDNNKYKHVVTQKTQKTNVLVSHSTGVKSCPKASGSQPKSNPKTNRISPAKGANKLSVEDLPRTNKSHLRTTNRVDSSSRLKRTVRKVWKPTGKVLTTSGHQWRPTGRILHLGKQCPLTRFTPPQVVSAVQNKKQASRTDRPLVFRFRLLKTYDRGSLTAFEFRESSSR
nr:integrase, catalytic region, zinc finger, CCHC-type, peptidase aspartic, catalytic [Tanacetum cinerariifolium]